MMKARAAVALALVVGILPGCKWKPSAPAPAPVAKNMAAIQALADAAVGRCKEALAVAEDDASAEVPASALTSAPELRQIAIDCFGPGDFNSRQLRYLGGRRDIELSCDKTTAVQGWEGPARGHEPDSYETIDRLSGRACHEDLLRVTAVRRWSKDTLMVARIALYANGRPAK